MHPILQGNNCVANLVGKVTEDTTIAIIEDHCHMHTMTAEQEVHRVIGHFHQAFSKVNNLTHTMFLDRDGFHPSGSMYRIRDLPTYVTLV